MIAAALREAKVFQGYAEAYDAIYHDKDYSAECDFVEMAFRRYGRGVMNKILDLGCGTGGHAVLLAQRGYDVCGIDRSRQMVEIAQRKAQEQALTDRLRFEVADLQTACVGENFDVAICMFAVMGYQTSNDELISAFRTIRNHLAPRGLFVFDCWYGPAVLVQRPVEKVKTVHDGEDRIIRVSTPVLDSEKNTVSVGFHILRLQGQELADEVKETHLVRYFFRPEIEFFLHEAGFRLVNFCPFLQLDHKVTEAHGSVAFIAEAVD